MELLSLIALAIIFLVTAWMIHFYASKTVTITEKIFVFIPWFLSFSVIVLTPLDIYYVNLKYYQIKSHIEPS